MKLAPMRFDGYTWHHNPKSLTVKSKKKSVELKLPYYDDVLQTFGESLVTLTGTGELYGSDCLEQFLRLNDVYKKGTEGILCLPGLSPFFACFDSLELVASDIPDVLTYSFVFVMTKPLKSSGLTQKSVDVTADDTLWDISFRHKVPMQKLLLLNPQIMFVNDMQGIERVRLC